MDKNASLLSRLLDTVIIRQTVDELIRLAQSRDGFKRQNAVRRLGKIGDPRAIAILIERANDWVPQVRESAYESIRQLMIPQNIEAFIAHIPDLYHLELCQRANHSGLITSVEDFLFQSQNRDALIEHLSSPNPLTVRMIFRVVSSRRLLPPAELALLGLAQNNVVVRSMAIDILRQLEGPEFDAVLHKGMADSFMPVRREAFQQLLQRTSAVGLAAARKFLFDRATSIREIAVRQLATAAVDIESIYASALEDNRSARIIACVLWGWAELKCVGRATQIRAFVTHASVSVRREAIRSLCRLLGAQAKPDLTLALSDKAASVCNEAARSWVKYQVPYSVDELFAIAADSPAEHTTYACARIASFGDKWEWLLVILHFLRRKHDSQCAKVLTRQLQTWELTFNRSASQPSVQLINRLTDEAIECRPLIDTHAFELLKFTLKSYGANL